MIQVWEPLLTQVRQPLREGVLWGVELGLRLPCELQGVEMWKAMEERMTTICFKRPLLLDKHELALGGSFFFEAWSLKQLRRVWPLASQWWHKWGFWGPLCFFGRDLVIAFPFLVDVLVVSLTLGVFGANSFLFFSSRESSLFSFSSLVLVEINFKILILLLKSSDH